MASELKPCICGKTPRLNRKKGSAGITKTPFYREQIVCRCGVSSKIFKAPNKAVEAWNTRPAPAATDTGLVTVGVQYAHEHSITGRALWGWQKEWKGCAAIGTRELVTRSQAEELLAAERAKADEYYGEAVVSYDRKLRVEELEADNAALTARVKELEADYEHLEHQALKDRKLRNEAQCDADLWRFSVDMGDHPSLLVKVWKQRKSLEAKLAAAEKALEFYAEQVSGCRKIGSAGDKFRASLDADGGSKARAVLGGKP